MIQLQKRRLYVLYSGSLLTYFLIIFFIFLFLIQAKGCMQAAYNALVMCAQSVIPSLFPFFVLSGLLMQTGFVQVAGALLSPLVQPLFRISGRGALVFLIGIISGYPTGAKMTADLYKESLIDRSEGRKLLPFCNNSGPLFIIGAVGSGMFGNVQIGIFLYLIHLLAALLVGLCFRFCGTAEKRSPLSVRTAIGRELRGYYGTENKHTVSECVANAVQTTLLICGFIIFFAAMTECFRPMLELIPSESARLLIGGALEITSGIHRVCTSGLLLSQKLIFISGLLGFGGICVHLQVFGVLSGTKLGMKNYLFGKLIHALFSAVLCAIMLRLIPFGLVTVWKQNAAEIKYFIPPWQMVLLGAVLFVFFIKKAAIFRKK